MRANRSRRLVVILLLLLVATSLVCVVVFIGRGNIHEAVKEENLEKVKALLARRPHLVDERTEYYEQTPLHVAANKGHINIAEVLLSHGADINAQDVNGNTPLHFAVINGKGIMAEFLVARGVRIDSKGSRDFTALHWAAKRGLLRISELLILKGADVNATAQAYAGHTPLHLAACSGHKEVATMLLRSGAKVNAKGEDGSTPLYWAVCNGKTQLVKLLLVHRANADVKAAGEHEITTRISAFGGASDNPKITVEYEWTALHMAAARGDGPVVELLLSYGADVNSEIMGGITPLWLAETKSHKEVAELLRKHGGKSQGPKDDKFMKSIIRFGWLNDNSELKM